MEQAIHTRSNHPMRRCTDCLEHSGIEKELQAHGIELRDLKADFSTLDDKLFKLLVGVLLCLMAASFSAGASLYVAMQSKVASHDNHKTQAEYAILVEKDI
jgi:hypothetical protein